jgi:hypothetical protein
MTTAATSFRRALVVLTSLAFTPGFLGCSTARLAGGQLVTPGAEPEGVELGRWRTEGCRDASGARLFDVAAKIRVMQKAGSDVVLVDTRIGYDTVISRNVSVLGSGASKEWVFDVAVKPEWGKPYVRQYRLPMDGTAGHYVLTPHFTDEDTDDGGFRAHVVRPALECDLAPATA